MPTRQSLSELAARIYKHTGSKADTARQLLAEGYTVNDIARAVPMAYSQVHNIAKKESASWQTRAHAAKVLAKPKTTPVIPQRRAGSAAVTARPTPARSPNRPTRTGHSRPSGSRIGKLRTPGLPSDIAVGECANCGHDLVIRLGNSGYMLVHVNITTEEYLATCQFCLAVPQSLV
jgi:hypothetical protein